MNRELTYNKWIKYIYDYKLNKIKIMKKDQALKKISNMLGDKHIHISDEVKIDDIKGTKGKVYVDNSLLMELIDEIATQMTEEKFGEYYHNTGFDNVKDRTYTLTDEAQDFYNKKYDEVESMINNITNIYSNNDER